MMLVLEKQQASKSSGRSNVFPFKQALAGVLAVFVLFVVSIYSSIRDYYLFERIKTTDYPALQLASATTRIISELEIITEHYELIQSNQTSEMQKKKQKMIEEIEIRMSSLEFTLIELGSIQLSHHLGKFNFSQSASFGKLIASFREKSVPDYESLLSLRQQIQEAIENYINLNNQHMESNLKKGIGLSLLLVLGMVGLALGLFYLYTLYQQNLLDLGVVSTKLEEERLKSVQSSKLASLGEMAAGVAHEINNPLAVILGRVDIMRMMIDKGRLTDQDTKNNLNVVADMCNRIAKIIRSMRKVAKGGSGTEITQFPVAEAIEDVLSLSSQRFKNHGIDVNTSEVQSDVIVSADYTHTTQIILNLLNNAVDALNSTIAEGVDKKVSVKTEILQDIFLVHILDNGPGIPQDIQKKLFEPFFTTKDIGKGTGLGLSISRSLAKEMGGELKLSHSNPEQGTCFTISFVIAPLEV
jgi:signal transduction histidine kinase